MIGRSLMRLAMMLAGPLLNLLDAPIALNPPRRPAGRRSSTRRRTSGRIYSTNSARECARRRRQIAAGQLRVSA
jgi:hypothetical protein